MIEVFFRVLMDMAARRIFSRGWQIRGLGSCQPGRQLIVSPIF